VQLLTYLSLVFTTLLWGGTFVAGRVLAGELAPSSSAFLRFLIASLALTAILIFTEKKPASPPRNTWLPLLLLGATGVFLYNVLFFYGLKHIGGGRASLIIACTPLTISLCGIIFLKERMTLIKGAGILVSLVGALVVISNGHLETILTLGFGVGEKAMVGCVLSWTAYSIIGRSVLRSLSPLSSVCYSSLVGTVLLFFPALAGGLQANLMSISNLGWLCLGYLGIFGTAVGFSLYYIAITRIGTTRAGVFINLVPVFGLLLSWLFLNESVTATVLTGGILVLAGIALTNYQGYGG